MKINLQKTTSCKEIINYILLVILEFAIATLNLYMANHSSNFEKITDTFGNLSSYYIKSFGFSALFPLLIGLFLSLLSKRVKYFNKRILNNAIKVLIFIIILDLFTLFFNIIRPI